MWETPVASDIQRVSQLVKNHGTNAFLNMVKDKNVSDLYKTCIVISINQPNHNRRYSPHCHESAINVQTMCEKK